MKTDRRAFLSTTSRVTAGFFGLRALTLLGQDVEQPRVGYGPLQVDPHGIFSLPVGFRYQTISTVGSSMSDGLLVPGAPDGMAAFAGAKDETVIIRNHELSPEQRGLFGANEELLSSIDRKKFYDAGEKSTVCTGGTTTIVYNTKQRRVVREFLSLGGTIRNCAGGVTPWNSWITCEEAQDLAGEYPKTKVTIEKDHGYNFEVPATSKISLADPIPLSDMGRFRHEAVAVDNDGVVYQTEDQDDSLLYRFLPKQSKQLASGGQLQTLHILDRPSCDTRNWSQYDAKVRVGEKLSVTWKNIDEPTAPKDDLRYRGFDDGAARFARGEGMWRGDKGEIYFAATSGGASKKGQIWKLMPTENANATAEGELAGTLELFIESHEPGLVENADNLTIAPWGDLIVCEDRDTDVVRLMGVTPDGQQYPFAMNHTNGELAGVCFSPDGSTLFVNLQKRGLTMAITGPWQQSAGWVSRNL